MTLDSILLPPPWERWAVYSARRAVHPVRRPGDGDLHTAGKESRSVVLPAPQRIRSASPRTTSGDRFPEMLSK